MPAIAKVEVLPLVAPLDRSGDLDGSNDTVVVRLTDEDGRTGIGECDAPPSVVAAFLEMPTSHQWSQDVRPILLGADPVETVALWEKLYEATMYPGRRGLGIHALSAVDIALHDLAGKQLGLPVYKLLGGARRDGLRPYATIFPGNAPRDHILAIHSLNPRSMKVHYDLYRHLMYGRSDLSRAEREMIAVVVSRVNECHY